MIVLDTNVISELFDGREHHGVLGWLDQNEPMGLHLTSITIAELVFRAEVFPDGKRKNALHQKIAQIVDDFQGRRLVFGDEAAYLYGAISARRKRAGHTMETKCVTIAAICLQHGAALATRNTKDFEGLDLTLVNPFEDA